MLTAFAFLAGFIGLLALALARHPVFGLWAYLATFYVHPPSRWWSHYLPDLRWALLAAAVTLVAVLVHRSKLRERPAWLGNLPAVILLAYCVWFWIQNLWALDGKAHFDASVQYTKYLIVFYLVYRLLDTPQRLREFLLVHVAGCAYLGLLAHLSQNFVGGRLNGVGGPGIDDANTLAMFLSTGVVAGAALVLSQSGWRRYFSVGALAFVVNGVILAASRGATLGLVAGGLVLTALHPRRYRRAFWVLAALGLVGFLAVADQRFINRMFTLEAVIERSTEMDGSAESRFALKAAQLQMFYDHPFGSGHKGTAALSPQYLDERYLARSPDGDAARSSHNTFLTALTEQGLPGALLFLALLAWILAAMFKVFRHGYSTPDHELVALAVGLCGGLIVVLVAGLGTDYLMAEVQFWFLAALVSSLQLIEATQIADAKVTAGGLSMPRPAVSGQPLPSGRTPPRPSAGTIDSAESGL